MSLYKKFLDVEKDINSRVFERNEPVRGLTLSTISGTNVLLLGPAGVAKSLVIRLWNARITNSVYFEWLLNKFSSPEELFGPVSFKSIKADHYQRNTEGKLPEANTAFIDEIFKANSSILNAMLPVLNERIFYNGRTPTKLALFTVAGASNEVPDSDDNLDAFYDRFLLKYHVVYITEDQSFIDMITSDGIMDTPQAFISKEDIIAAQQEVDKVVFPKDMQQIYVKLRKSLRAESFHVSDRTYKISVKLLKSEAWLHGREAIDTPDFEVLKHVIWTMPDQRKKAQSLILDIIAPEKNRIYELLEECNKVYSKVFEKKTAKERINEAMEALGNLKKSTLEITKLKNIIAQRGTSVDEITDVEKKIEAMKRTLLVDELGSTTLL
jgi:MoxR-like ATPase